MRITVELDVEVEDSASLRQVAAQTLSEIDSARQRFGSPTLWGVAFERVRAEDVQQSDESAFGVLLVSDLMLTRRLFPGCELRSASVDSAS